MAPFPFQGHEVEGHGGHTIEINEIVNRHFDFEYVGWAFRVFQDRQFKFQMAITTAGMTIEGDRDALYRWGLDWVHNMIDTRGYELQGDYCFEWARGLGNPQPDPIDCKEARRKPGGS
jgi:hypothetical protein